MLDESSFEPLPGPVLIGATRLLHKRFRRLNAFHEQGKAPLRRLAAKLAARAAEAGWDDSEYWGWDGSAYASAVMEEYAESNAVFAEFVWGTPWPEPWSTGRPRPGGPRRPRHRRFCTTSSTTVDALVEAADHRGPPTPRTSERQKASGGW